MNNDYGTNEGRSTAGRWWEQYTVRYFVGTIVGAVVIGLLLFRPYFDPEWGPIAPELIKSLDPKVITALTAMGLAYCYVASAPMLTFHAVRGALRLDATDGTTVLCGLLAMTFVVYRLGKNVWDSKAGWLALIGIVGLQVILISVASQNSFRSTKEFYDDLVAARLNDWQRKRDYVDSYRHLREHGNALAIVFFEVALGFILSAMKGTGDALFAIVLWVLPGAWSWVVGGALEAHFARRTTY